MRFLDSLLVRDHSNRRLERDSSVSKALAVVGNSLWLKP
jgi:hypothetical protein